MPEINSNNSSLNNSQQATVSEHDTSTPDALGKSRQGQSIQQVKPDSVFSRIKTFFGKALKLRSITDRQATVVHTAMDVIPEMIPGKVEQLGLNDVEKIKRKKKPGEEDFEVGEENFEVGEENFEKVGEGHFGKVYPVVPKVADEIGKRPQKLHKNYVVKEQVLGSDGDQGTEELIREAKEEARFQKGAKGSVPVVDERILEHEHSLLSYQLMMEHGGQELCALTGLTNAEVERQLKVNPDEPPQGTPVDEGMSQVIATELFKQLADLHENNVAHRDIKPGNVLINQQGKARIIDFGFAQKAQEDTSSVDSDALKYYGQLGTPPYVAPEVIQEDTYSEKVDCWAMGMMLYELLTGEMPFPVYEQIEDDETGQTDINFVFSQYTDFCDIIDDHPDLSPEAKETILSLIALDPKDRPSARDVLNQDFFQIGRTQPGGTHFQLQAQHQEKIQALAEKERQLKEVNVPEVVEKRRFRKPRVVRGRTEEADALMREIRVSGLEVKSLQAKMDLKDLNAEANRLNNHMTATLEQTPEDDRDRARDNLSVQLAVTERDIRLKQLEIEYIDSATHLTQQKNCVIALLAENKQDSSPDDDYIEQLTKQDLEFDTRLRINDVRYQLACLKAEQSYFENNPEALNKKQRAKAKKMSSLLNEKQKEFDDLEARL